MNGNQVLPNGGFANGLQVLQSVNLGAVPSNWTIAGTDGLGTIVWGATRGSGTVGLGSRMAFRLLKTVTLGAVPNNWSIVGVGDFDWQRLGRHSVAG